MNSEKVKEIKKALKCCINLKEKCDNKKCYLFDKLEYHYCERQLKQDILSLINELEKENETKTDTIVDLLKKQEFYENEKLKQFAERLKEKFYYEGRICRYIIDSDIFDETLKEFIE